MSTLRKRQKEARRASIIAAADQLFRSKGYSRASIEDIAAKANLSIATVYNYFGTKFDLLFANIQPEIRRVKEETAALLANPPADPLEGVVALARCYVLSPDWRNREMLEPFARDYLLGRNRDSNVFEQISAMRADQFRKLIAHYKSVGGIERDMHDEDAVFLITGLFHLQLRELMTGVVTTAAVLSNLERQLRFAFAGSVKAGERDRGRRRTR